MPLPLRFGKYDLVALLATGGMAEIWLARLGSGASTRRVVVKRLLEKHAADPDYVRMFLDEGRINARLTHANVVQVIELGQVEGRYFMALEYVPGLSLATVGRKATRRLGDVPQAVACGVVAQACVGLHYAHERRLPDGTPLGIVHRDVSPQNLILAFDGLVKLLDFGIAKAEGRATTTKSGLVKGKFAYMSPEQCLGLALDRRSDIFSLGIVLFELCTARRLFKRGNSYQSYEAITAADVPRPRELNPKIAPAVEQVILRSLRRQPEDRFPTAAELGQALESAMSQAGLKGGRSDLEAFVAGTFAPEIAEHRQLLAEAERGELVGPRAAQVSAVAELAQEEMVAGPAYAPGATDAAGGEGEPTEKYLTPLGADSGSMPVPPALAVAFEGELLPAVPVRKLKRGPTPPLYVVLAALVLLAATSLVWLLAR